MHMMLRDAPTKFIRAISLVLALGCGQTNGSHEDSIEPPDETMTSSTSLVDEGNTTAATSEETASSTTLTSSEESGSVTDAEDTHQDPNCPEVMKGRVEFKDADIERFRCLREVQGELIVYNNQLADLTVFSNLERVTSSFYVSKGAQLQSLRGLENLVEVGGQMWVSNNPLLNDLTALSSIRISGGLGILHHEMLTDLTSFVGDFPNPTEDLGRSLNLGHLPRTEHLTGLESITLFEGRIYIHQNPNLVDLLGLSEAMKGARPRTNLQLLQNPVLSSFTGLEHLTEMETLELAYHPNLRSMQGLNGLKKAQEIWVQLEEHIESLDGLESLEEVETLAVGGCLAHAPVGSPNLRSVEGLRNLKRIGTLNFTATGLTSLKGLENVESVDRLVIAGNPDLPWAEVEAFAARFDDQHSVLCGNKDQAEGCPPCDRQGEASTEKTKAPGVKFGVTHSFPTTN